MAEKQKTELLVKKLASKKIKSSEDFLKLKHPILQKGRRKERASILFLQESSRESFMFSLNLRNNLNSF